MSIRKPPGNVWCLGFPRAVAFWDYISGHRAPQRDTTAWFAPMGGHESSFREQAFMNQLSRTDRRPDFTGITKDCSQALHEPAFASRVVVPSKPQGCVPPDHANIMYVHISIYTHMCVYIYMYIYIYIIRIERGRFVYIVRTDYTVQAAAIDSNST